MLTKVPMSMTGYRAPTTFASYGAVGDGVADDTTAIIKGASSGKVVDTDEGATYRITVGAIPVIAGMTINNTGNASFVYDGVETGSVSIFSVRTSGVVFNSPKFVNKATADNVTGVLALGAQKLRINSPESTDCKVLVCSTSGATDYASILPNGPNVCRDIVVLCPTATGRNAMAHGAAVELFYAQDWSVIGGAVSSMKFGVQWWGGDSNHTKNGALTNERKSNNGLVVGMRVRNGMAGVWGSMGQNIAVSTCTVDTMSDVGIDFEGCFNGTATGNTVKDCVNGNYTTFFMCRNIEFIGNSSFQSAAGAHYRCYNSSQTQDNKSVSFNDNTCSTATGFIGSIDMGSGTVETFVAKGNTCTNVIISASANNSRYVTISDNTLNFDTAVALTQFPIASSGASGNGRTVVSGNTVRSSVAQPAGMTAMNFVGTDFNSATTFHILSNETEGFPTDITTTHAGGNSGVGSFFNLVGNRLGSEKVVRVESGAGMGVVRMVDNTDLTGAPYPGIIPTEGRWDAGVRIPLRTPLAGNYWEAICTVTGSPGTWKGVGAAAA